MLLIVDGFFFKQYKIAYRIFPPFLEAHKIFVSFSVFLLLIFDFTQCYIFLKCTSPRILFRNGIRGARKKGKSCRMLFRADILVLRLE